MVKILLEIFAHHLAIVEMECVALTFITNMLIALSTQTSQWCQQLLNTMQPLSVHFCHFKYAPPWFLELTQLRIITPPPALEFMSILPILPAIRYICASYLFLCTPIKRLCCRLQSLHSLLLLLFLFNEISIF